jgi:hypothetical protein
MKVSLKTVAGERVLFLPEGLGEAYEPGRVVELVPVIGGVKVRPVGLTFTEAATRVFTEKSDLLQRLGDGE